MVKKIEYDRQHPYRNTIHEIPFHKPEVDPTHTIHGLSWVSHKVSTENNKKSKKQTSTSTTHESSAPTQLYTCKLPDGMSNKVIHDGETLFPCHDCQGGGDKVAYLVAEKGCEKYRPMERIVKMTGLKSQTVEDIHHCISPYHSRGTVLTTDKSVFENIDNGCENADKYVVYIPPSGPDADMGIQATGVPIDRRS